MGLEEVAREEAHWQALDPLPPLRPDSQHHQLRWLSPEELGTDPSVHPYTRAYAR